MTQDQKNILAEILRHDPEDDARAMSPYDLTWIEALFNRTKATPDLLLTTRELARLNDIWEHLYG